MFLTENLTLELRSVIQKLNACKSQYNFLGLFLNVPLPTISGFEKFTGDCSRCLLIILDGYLREKRPSVEELCAGLVQINRRNLAESLEQKYAGEIFQMCVSVGVFSVCVCVCVCLVCVCVCVCLVCVCVCLVQCVLVCMLVCVLSC